MQQQRTSMPPDYGMANAREMAYDRSRTMDWSGEITAQPGMRPALNTGIGGMALSIGKVTITAIACALVSGILINILLNKFKKPQDTKED